MALRRVPIRRVGNRHNLYLNGDRELVMFTGLLCGVMIFVVQSWLAAFLGIALWFYGLWVLRKMAKSDPLMRKVYFRALRYQAYYPPRATPFRNNTETQARQYK